MSTSRRMGLSAFVLVTAAILLRAEEVPDLDAVLARVDSLSSFSRDFSAICTIHTDDPEKGSDDRTVAFFRRDANDEFLVLTLEPATQKGQGHLLVADNLWVYDPVSRQFSHSSLKDNYESTEARNSDFRRSRKSEDYRITGYAGGKLGNFDCWVVELEGKNDGVTYPYLRMWITKKDYLTLKVEEYSLTRRLLRTSLYPSYTDVGGTYVADRMIFVDGIIAGKRTEVRFTQMSTKALPNDMFSKAYLERVGR